MRNGHWALAYNDTEEGRHSLAISISTDEGTSWEYTRHLELDTRDRNTATNSAYPSIIQGRGDILHVVYSYHRNDRKDAVNKTIKYASFNEAWVRQGDASKSK
jgi:predicted neuraminidase